MFKGSTCMLIIWTDGVIVWSPTKIVAAWTLVSLCILSGMGKCCAVWAGQLSVQSGKYALIYVLHCVC